MTRRTNSSGVRRSRPSGTWEPGTADAGDRRRLARPSVPADDEHDVIIVGAGAAGLAAAIDLAQAGRRVVVLEAKSRMGGRIMDESSPGWPGPVPLGAEFVHGTNASIRNAVQRAHLVQKDVRDRHWLIRNGQRIQEPDAWEQINTVMKRIGPRFRGSFAQWLARHGRELSEDERQLAENFVRGFQAAPPARMSASALFDATKEDDTQSRIEGGYGQLVEFLVARGVELKVMVSLKTVVTSIAWRPNEVIAQAQDGRRWRGTCALITLPLGVLATEEDASGHISFRPPLARKVGLWRRLESGHAIRLVLRMRSDVWRRGVIPRELRASAGRGFGFLHSNEACFPVWWSAAPAPMLIGWTGGPVAAEMGEWKSPRIFARGVKTLAGLIGCERSTLARAIVDWRMHNWTADPFARGAYSYATAGLETAPKQMAKPVAQTLFFAGEATADMLELGTVNGALASGERAAREILAVARKRRAS